MDAEAIIKWLGLQGVTVALGVIAGGDRVFCLQDGRHSLEAYEQILKRVHDKKNEQVLLDYLRRHT